jgi:hypothetical protein
MELILFIYFVDLEIEPRMPLMTGKCSNTSYSLSPTMLIWKMSGRNEMADSKVMQRIRGGNGYIT